MSTAAELIQEKRSSEKSQEVPKISDTGDHDRFQHYFLKSAIERNSLDGVPMTALCGKVLKYQVDPLGRTICQTCQEMMDQVVGKNLPEGERD